MSRKRILLIVEGKKQEVSLFRALFACYRLDLEYEIFPYGTNIYELYERMFADGAQDDLTLLGVLKERAPAEDRWLFDQNYYKRLKSEGKILVLGMCLLFILDYSANMVDVAQFTSEKGQALI